MKSRKSIFKLSRSQWISVAVLVSSLGLAIAMTAIPPFTTGTQISSGQMNTNFGNVVAAVTTVETSLATAQADIVTAQGRITALEAAVPAANSTTQVLNANNLTISLTCATPTVITTMTLTGPATYLLTASGFLFSSGAATQVNTAVNLFRDATQLAHGEVGAITNAVGFLSASYGWSRLVNVTAASSTFQVRACRQAGDGTPVVFTNSLNATLIGTGTGAQLAPLAVEEGLPVAEGTR